MKTGTISSSIIYHDIFEYPLSEDDVVRWVAGPKAILKKKIEIGIKNGYVYKNGRHEGVLKRKHRINISEEKTKIGEGASNIISQIPTVKFVGITGALAMKNAVPDSDIDLLIITTENTLWITRILVNLALLLNNYGVRRSGDKNQKDKLCLNMWMDASDLVFKTRNIFTAHEIAQIVPLVNKENTYEILLQKNKWILDYWPNSVVIKNDFKNSTQKESSVLSLFEGIAYKAQYEYMKRKITRETITKTRAFFHPYDWSNHVKDLLK